MEKKLRIAIIGCGGISKAAHYPGYKLIKNAEVVACCDILPDRVKEYAEERDIPVYCTDYKEILKMENVDAVDLCVPNYLHSIIAVDALNAGKHVFCEKPDAVSVEEAEKMKAAAEKNGKVLMIMRNNRWRADAKFMKDYIEAGKMGDIYAARCGWIRRRGIPGRGGWFTTKAQSGGGPLIDLGVHMIDLTMYLMGNPTPVSVVGCTYNKLANSEEISDSAHSGFGDSNKDGIFDVEDLAMGFIKFDNGACLQIEFSWASNIEKENTFVELRGSKSGATLDLNGFKIFTEEFGKTVDYIPNVKEIMPQHAANIQHFVNVVLNGDEPDFVPQQGINMIKILEAFYKSAETGKEVML